MKPIIPNWPAPSRVKAYVTTRTGGVSQAPYNALNLSTMTGDNPECVDENRRKIMKTLGLPQEPFWLEQVHGTTVVEADKSDTHIADASYTRALNTVCAVLTADCLPLLLCDTNGTYVAAIHAGWRGLAAGVIEQTLATLPVPPNEVLVWLGPAMGPRAFEVGPEVREQFLEADPNAVQAFSPSKRPDRWMADIYLLAKQRLIKHGIHAIYGGEECTYSDSKRFFSYRRDGEKTGRMASLIWLSDEQDNQPIARGKRLTMARNMTNLSREDLAKKYQLSSSTLQSWETPKHGGLTQKGAAKIVAILAKEGIQCSTDWLLSGIGVGPQAIGKNRSYSPESAIIAEILTFRTHNPDAIDIIVKDDGLDPIYCEGDYVGGRKRYDTAISTAIGKTCIVETTDGETLLRYLRPGHRPNHYTLICLNPETTVLKPVLYDIALKSAAPIIWHRRKEP